MKCHFLLRFLILLLVFESIGLCNTGYRSKKYIDICGAILKELQLMEDKSIVSMNIKAIMEFKSSSFWRSDTMKNVLTSFGDQLVPDNARYLDDESLILTALIHKARGDQGWYESESKYIFSAYYPPSVAACYCIAFINSIFRTQEAFVVVLLL